MPPTTTLTRLTSPSDNRWATRYTNGWTIYKPGHGVLAEGLSDDDIRRRFHLS